MKVVILCGGKGLRLKTDNDSIPKPLAMVKGKPIIWHIMKQYSKFGFHEFILTLGYKGEKIKEYFMNYEWLNFDFEKDYGQNKINLLQQPENWKITFIDTGTNTMTGGRIKRIEKYIDTDTFMMAYGDGLADINIPELLQYHKQKGKVATVTGIERKSLYGILTVRDGIAESFEEKTKLEGIVNGGFFVLNKGIFNYIDNNDNCIFEKQPMAKIADEGELAVYPHKGQWIAIDTYKDLLEANKSWRVQDF